jgi:chromosome partitioning protein
MLLFLLTVVTLCFNVKNTVKTSKWTLNMNDQLITSSSIRKLYRLDKRNKSMQSLFNAEEKNEIPKAQRIARGKVLVRNWTIDQLPAIGRKFGFLNLPEKPVVYTKYIPKGGVLKTTTTYNEARTYALNGIKTLIIGQDEECSITDVTLPKKEVIRLEDNENRLGLYHFFVEGAPMESVIKKTSLPTLDIIPETHDLVVLDKWLSQQPRREYIYRDKLLPELLNRYDVIIFDNGSGWNHRIENAIVCSDAVVTPLGCNLLAYNAVETNLATIIDFQNTMQLANQQLIMFSTMLGRSTLSQQINSAYLSKYKDLVLPISIRFSVKGEEALMKNQTIMEYAPKSPLAEDCYRLITAMWDVLLYKKTIHEIQLQIADDGEE